MTSGKLPATGKPCHRTFPVYGHFAHRPSATRGTLTLPRTLSPGRYRLTARARAHGSNEVGATRKVTFAVP